MFARFSTFDADEVQPFGTSALQETLVPGFGRTLDTNARNLGVSHTRVFGRSVVNEAACRLDARQRRAGQRESRRRLRQPGRPAGRHAAIRATSGFRRSPPAGSTAPSAIRRRSSTATTSISSSTTTSRVDRGAHRLKFGGYYFHLQFSPEQPDNARGAFTYTGQFSGNAFADFLLGYPTSAVAGIGRGDEDGRTNWLHLFAQDDWRMRGNLTVNLGLRYEYNQHMRDVRQSAVVGRSTSTPGGRFVIASDDDGRINPDAQALLAADSDPVRHLERGGVGARPARSRARSAWRPAPDSRCRSTTTARWCAAATASS